MSAFFNSIILFILFSPLRFAEANGCSPEKCRRNGPWIRFPFRIRGKQLESCGHPGFDVYCNERGDTMLDLPHSVNLTVKKIDYRSQRIYLADPEKCLAQKLQTLNITSSRFEFFDEFLNLDVYILFNCTDSKRDLRDPVPCLSGSTYQFYAVLYDSYMDSVSLTSCTSYRNVSSVPSYVFSKNDLHLNWSEPACGGCESQGRICAAPLNSSTTQIQCLDREKTREGGYFFNLVLQVDVYL